MEENNIPVSVFWFRRDLRLEDNIGFWHALQSGLPVLPIFIFDQEIISELPKNDARISFIYTSLKVLHLKLRERGSSLLIQEGNVHEIWKQLVANYTISKVYINGDYEPYAIARDEKIKRLLESHQIEFTSFKDQVIFEKDEILKKDQSPYTVFTPYKNQWLLKLKSSDHESLNSWDELSLRLYQFELLFPSLEDLGFKKSKQKVMEYDLNVIPSYDKFRDFPNAPGTSYLSPHLRFGTVSVRYLVREALAKNAIFLSELIWREFFMQILYHFPQVVTRNFKRKYDGIQWRDHQPDFIKWCEGNTGYPLVDAGMRQLNTTGYMHNRVRMVCASFLCKHLLIDWRLGEAYFAQKLLDYELSSNNGNWQWAAGTGCDAAPYFRVFNPSLQLKKFDKDMSYVKKWIPELYTGYTIPMVDHAFARNRCLETYKKGLAMSNS